MAVLEPERFRCEWVQFDGPRRAGKLWESFEAEHLAAGHEILKADEMAECLTIGAAVHNHPLAASYLAQGRAEQTLAWMDPETGLACKGRVDWLCDVPGLASVVDLKTTADLDEYRFTATVARLGHASQLAFYLRGLRALGLPQPAEIIAVESDAPYDVGVFELDADALANGDEEVGRLLRRVAECRERNEWPGRYGTTLQPLRLPAWMARAAEDEPLGITIAGLEV
jgi:hypothetical protein